MELRVKLAWLVLSACAVTVQSLGVEAGSNGVVDIQTLTTGMHVLQTVSVSGQRQQAPHTCLWHAQTATTQLMLCPTPFCVLQVAQIAHFLDISASSSTFSHITTSIATNTALRQALETTCRIRDRVVSLSDLRREMAGDVEVNALLQVLKYNLRDSCHWVRAKICIMYS